MKVKEFIKKLFCKHKWLCVGSKTYLQMDSCEYVDTFKCIDCGKSKTEKFGWSR